MANMIYSQSEKHGVKAVLQGRYFGYVLLAGGLLLAFAGILRGEAAAVWEKAASICFQCIGIG